jgi:hypothetical protein
MCCSPNAVLLASNNYCRVAGNFFFDIMDPARGAAFLGLVTPSGTNSFMRQQVTKKIFMKVTFDAWIVLNPKFSILIVDHRQE